MKVQIKSNVQNTNQSYDFKVDQKHKIFVMKNDDSGKAALASLEEDATTTEETQERVSFWKFVFRPGPSKNRKESNTLCLISSRAGG